MKQSPFQFQDSPPRRIRSSPRLLIALVTLFSSAASFALAARSPTENRPMHNTQPRAATVSSPLELTGEELWRIWHDQRFVSTAAACIKHQTLTDEIDRLTAAHPRVEVEVVGHSFEGRAIRKLSVGSGERRILLWSQMHGDEPSATPALLDLVDFLMRHQSQPRIAQILATFELHLVPMLNPDGSERFERRNAQGIDINRDALNLATPEGRLLKELRDRLEPFIGFNLHDQNRRTLLPDSGKLSSMSVLAVSGDEAGTVTEGRRRTMRACSAVVASTAFHLDGRIGRYDEDWSPRAFGDNLTAWGTPVILIESGGVPPGHSLADLTALNFVALVSVLDQLAVDDLAAFDERTYQQLPRTGRGYSDIVLRDGRVLQPGTTTPYRADIALNRVVPERPPEVCTTDGQPSYSDATRTLRPAQAFLTEVGDARYEVGGEELRSPTSVFLRPLAVALDPWSFAARIGGTGESSQTKSVVQLLQRLMALGVGTVHLTGSDFESSAEALAPIYELARSSDRALPRLLQQPVAENDPRAPLLSDTVLDEIANLEIQDVPARLGAVLSLLQGEVLQEEQASPEAPSRLAEFVPSGDDQRIQPGSRADLLELRAPATTADADDLLQHQIGALLLGGEVYDFAARTRAFEETLLPRP